MPTGTTNTVEAPCGRLYSNTVFGHSHEAQVKKCINHRLHEYAAAGPKSLQATLLLDKKAVLSQR